MKYLVLLLLVFTSGCAELHQYVLGARVHTVTVKGVELIHCSVVMDRNQPQLAHDALEVCRDAIQGMPQPLKK